MQGKDLIKCATIVNKDLAQVHKRICIILVRIIFIFVASIYPYLSCVTCFCRIMHHKAKSIFSYYRLPLLFCVDIEVLLNHYCLMSNADIETESYMH
jgi:hypothetical protein